MNLLWQNQKLDIQAENDALVIEDEWVEDDDGNFVAKEK